MVNLLAVDTTTDVCSVALAAGEDWFEDTRLVPRMHNLNVMAMVDNVIDAAPIARDQINFIGFGAGPGSFTGVRIGAAVAQGIAFGIRARVIALPSAAVIAEAARRVSGLRGNFVICRESRPGWRYLSHYRLADEGIQCLELDRLAAADEIIDQELIDGAGFAVSARIVAELALSRISEAVPPALVMPYYVDGDSPWRPSH